MKYDENKIIEAITLLKPNNQLFEVRVLAGKNATASGYFTDANVFIEQFKKMRLRDGANIYFTLNEIETACYSRKQKDRFVENATPTTSDADISVYGWMMIDIDPKRPSGTSATDAQLELAKLKANGVYKFLKSKGFNSPVIAMSGNGVHLLYPIGLKNTRENIKLVENSLKALDMIFSDDEVAIDTSTFNPARICKLYGTMAQKGSNTHDRPHRMSCIIKVPDEIKQNDRSLLEALTQLLPKPEKPKYKGFNATEFDIDNFISRNVIRVVKVSSWSGGTKYVLDECLFDSSHKEPDAAIIKLDTGALTYHCFHNSCQKYTWQDVRQKYEPDAYRKKQEQPRVTHPNGMLTRPIPDRKAQPPTDKFLRLEDIKRLDRSQIVSVPSGIIVLDRKMIGFNKGEVTIWSGGNGSGKSTILSQLALEAVNIGFNVAMFSGELTNMRMKNWIHLQAAGRQYVRQSRYENVFYTPNEVGEKIDAWTGEKLWIYNNDYGMGADSVLADIKTHIGEHNTDVVIIDNLMSLDLSRVSGEKYDRQSLLVLMLTDMAKQLDIHIHFVCHPRKPTGFLRKADISGTADLTNAADNVIMMHRVNNDFKNMSKAFFEKGKAEKYFGFTNVIEVMKNRDLGVEDELIGLYFERESKRLLNEPHENKNYNWNDFPFYEDMDENDPSNPFAKG